MKVIRRLKDLIAARPQQPMLCLLLIGICVGQLLLPVTTARAAAETDRPNVVLIAIDTLRADHLSCYGYERKTSPNIDKLSEEGVLFENCYSTASWTLPSFASVFTGLMPTAHGCFRNNNTIPAKSVTLGEQFDELGYFCAGIVSNPLLNAKYGFGRGFKHYDDYSVFLDAELALYAAVEDESQPNSLNELVSGQTVTQGAIRLIDKAEKSGKPAFVFIHYFDPHDSYVPPLPFNRAFSDNYSGPIDGRRVTAMRNSPPTGADMAELIALYDGEISYEDREIGKLIEHIDKTLGDNTIIVFFSDHGEAFGEHGQLLHGNQAYIEEQHVPMIWRWPGHISSSGRVEQLTSIVNIYQTLHDIIGFKKPFTQQGHTLLGTLTGQGDAIPDDVIIYTERALYTFVEKRAPNSTDKHDRMEHYTAAQHNYRLHVWFDKSPLEDGIWSLFDLSNDPKEQTDIYGSESKSVAHLREALLNHWRSCMALRARYIEESGPAEVQLSEKEKRRLKGLGYIIK